MNLSSAILVVCVLFGVAVAFAGHSYWRSLRESAAAGDHVVETPREVAIPDHCVSCGAAHASETLLVYPSVMMTRSRRALIGDPRLKGGYPFRFCSPCAAPIRRHRRIGNFVRWGGFALVACSLPLLFTWSGITKHFGETDFYRSQDLRSDAFGAAFIGGWAIALAGQLMRRYAPPVTIFDQGEKIVLFRFRNQIFRNHFSEINGVR